MRSRLHDALAIVFMTIGVIAVYFPLPPAPGEMVLAGDYHQLHERRMRFAREALLGASHALPAWYPRELLGTPFRANVQNFPFIPTRLIVLLALDPSADSTYPIAVILSAVLAALFTYLYCRTIGLGLFAAAMGGWTFACSGYYASRIAAGHLPLLEAYLALPLLLWTVESFLRSRAHRGRWILAVGVSAMCVALAGHPQLPVYSLTAAAVYSLWRGRVLGSHAVASMVLGVGCAAFALWPMALLIGRSTRVLSLAAAENDVALPYSLLRNFFAPWANGYAPPLVQAQKNLFHGYPNFAWFWDTFCYIGWMPWIAVVVLAVLWFISRREVIDRRITMFLILLGAAGIVLALPLARDAWSHVSTGTLLRSPARLLYFTGFAVALALAVAVQRVITSPRNEGFRFLLYGALSFHIFDLARHDRVFIAHDSAITAEEIEFAQLAADSVGSGRAAFDYLIPAPANRSVDDVGVFDSILLARPYRFLLDLSGADPNLNMQFLDGWQLSRRALQASAVKAVIAQQESPEFEVAARVGRLKLFPITPTADRAAFFAANQVRFDTSEQIHAALHDRQTDAANTLMLPFDAPRHPEVVAASLPAATVSYVRSSSDRIECTLTAPQAGYLRIIESFDPGWTARVDDQPTPVVAAWDALLAVPVAAGTHRVEFVYRTPGAIAGVSASVVSLTLLSILALRCAATCAKPPQHPTGTS